MSLRRNGFLLVVFGVLLAILSEWSTVPVFGRWWLLPFALLLGGLAYEHWNVRLAPVALKVDPPAMLKLGRASTVGLTFTHDGARQLDLEFVPDAPANLGIDDGVQTVHIDKRGTASWVLTVFPRRLGTHAWPTIRARAAGILGLAWWDRTLSPVAAATVVPDAMQSGRSRAGEAALGNATRSRIGSGGEVVQLREYRPGDPLRTIDWKASARARTWVSRDYAEDQHLEIVLAIDAGRASALRSGPIDRLGQYANIAARFAEHAVARDDRVGLVIFADKPLAVVPPTRGLPAVLRIRKLLTALHPASAESNPLEAALRIRTLVRHRTLVIFLTDLEDATLASQLSAATRLLMPKHLPFVAGLASHDVEALARGRASSAGDVYNALAGQEFMERLIRNVGILKAQGVAAVAAYPEHLEAAVFAAYDSLRQRRKV